MYIYIYSCACVYAYVDIFVYIYISMYCMFYVSVHVCVSVRCYARSKQAIDVCVAFFICIVLYPNMHGYKYGSLLSFRIKYNCSLARSCPGCVVAAFQSTRTVLCYVS